MHCGKVNRLIVYEKNDCFVMVEQHQHALLSGEFAKRWAVESFLDDPFRDAVVCGISQHDRSWIDLDGAPFWNDARQRPYTFMDFPLIPKLTFYRKGIDEAEQMDPYAALLDSMHYCSFLTNATDEQSVHFVSQERARQARIMDSLDLRSSERQERLQFHFQLLQFCDDLSLYICMQEPGVSKEQEIDWYKNGFKQQFDFAGGRKIVPSWESTENLALSEFPFAAQFTTELRLKVVSKSEIQKVGLLQAFQSTPDSKRVVTFVPH